MATATIGVCMGAICAISIVIVAEKWLNGHVADVDAWRSGLYYAVFLTSVAWSFIRGAALAGVELLWFNALATVAVPLTTLASWAFPGLGMRPSASMATVGVDLVALCAALCFVWMARATARRARYGPADSVWAAPHRARRLTSAEARA